MDGLGWLYLPCQGELHAEAEVLGDGGVCRRGEQGYGTLAVVEERHCHVAAHGVVCTEGRFHRLVARSGLGQTGLDVASDGILIADRKVETQGQGMCKIALAAVLSCRPDLPLGGTVSTHSGSAD